MDIPSCVWQLLNDRFQLSLNQEELCVPIQVVSLAGRAESLNGCLIFLVTPTAARTRVKYANRR